MTHMLYGLLFGVLAGSLLYSFWILIPEVVKSNEFIILIAKIAAFFSIAYFAYEVFTDFNKTYFNQINIPDHKRTIEWAQWAFGVFAGFACLSWLRHSIVNLVDPVGQHTPSQPAPPSPPTPLAPTPIGGNPQATTTVQQDATSVSVSGWWDTQPWQAIVLILLVVIGATFLPELPNLLAYVRNNVTKFKVAGFEVEIRNKIVQEIAKGNKLNIERTRQITSIAFLTAFSAKVLSNEGNESSIRALSESHQEWPKIKLKQIKDGNAAFLELNKNLLAPAFKCILSLYERGASAEDLRGLTRKLTWSYKELLFAVSSADSVRSTKGGEHIRHIIRDMENKTRGWMGEHSCREELKKVRSITVDQALKLPNSAWTHVALSAIQYLNEDRLEAINTLERQRKDFSHDISLQWRLGELWAQEPGQSARTIAAYKEVYRLASDYLRNTQKRQYDPKKREELSAWEYDKDRWIGTLRMAEASYAYSLLHSNVGTTNEAIGQALYLSADLAKDEYKTLAGEDFDSIPTSTVLNAAGKNALDFWAHVDTYALALVASLSSDQTRSGASDMNDSKDPRQPPPKPFDQRDFRDDITCAIPLLQAGKQWVFSQFRYVKPECNENDNNCYKIRTEYPRLSSLYQAIASHEEVALERVERAVENGDLSPCPEQSMWDKLLYEKPR